MNCAHNHDEYEYETRPNAISINIFMFMFYLTLFDGNIMKFIQSEDLVNKVIFVVCLKQVFIIFGAR